MTVIPTVLHILAGIGIFAGLYHIIAAMRGVDRKIHLTFGLSILAIPVYTLSSAYLYTSQNAEMYLHATRIQMFCSAYFFILYCWFIAFYSKIIIKPFLYIVTFTYAIIPFIRLFFPTTLTYKNIEGIRTILLPWGEQINTIRAELSTFGYFYFTFIIVIMLYPLVIAYKLLQKNEKPKGICLIVCQCFIISTVSIDIVFDAFQLQWFYSGEFGFLSLIVYMSYKLSDNLDNTIARKHYRDEIKTERDKLKAIMDGLSKEGIGIDIISCDYEIPLQNSVLKERFCTPSGKTCHSKYINNTFSWETCPVQEAITSKKTVATELTGRDGRIYHIYCAPLASPVGTINKAIEVIIDITERKESEIKHRLSEKRFTQIAKNMEEIFFLMEKSTHSILYISPMCEPILGIHPDKFLSKQQDFFDLIHPDDRTGMIFLDNELRYTETHNEEFRIIRPDRKIRWLRLKAFPIFDNHQNPCRSAGVISDITDFKIAQEQSNIQQQQLIQADKLASIGLMVSGVAHEINNPNNLIMMNGGVIKTFWEEIKPFLLNNNSISCGIKEIAGIPVELTCKEFERMLDGILSGSNRIQTIVQDLKNFTRDEPDYKSNDVSIEKVIQTSYSLVSNLIKKSTNHFKIINGKNIPLLHGNRQKLEQVIINMLTNACQAMTSKDDSIILSSSYNEEKEEISIIIEDTGAGISENNLKKIMDPFFTTKREDGGTGLGLSVSYGIIKDHEGNINVESQKGKGTKFTIILPTGEREESMRQHSVSQIIT